jgi:hypothetical protein
MNTKAQKTFLISLFFVFFAIAAPAWSAEVVSISITSSQSGLNGKTTGKIQIERTSSGYVGNLDIRHVGSIRKKNEEFEEFPVPTKYIKRFQKSLQANSIPKLDLNQLNITQEWIRKRIEEALEIDFKKYSPKEYLTLESRKALILDRLVDVKKTLLKLQRHYKSEWFDDYPKVEVLVKLDDGNSISLYSKAQHLFMIPWTIKKNNKTAITYDIEISKALSEILTENLMNYQRIKGSAKFLRSFIWIFDISPSHQTLWAERDFGNQLGPIYKDFIIIDADVSSITSDPCCNDSCCEENDGPFKKIYLSIGHKTWSDNLMAGIRLPIKQDKLDWTDYSVQKISKHADHLLSIPWLREYMATYPLANFAFTYYDKGLSIDSKSFKNTLSKLKEKKDFEWSEKDFPYSEDIISLNIRDLYSHWASWLVFPDKTILVISATGNPDLNGATVPFSAHLKVWSDLSGARISPEGEIMHP